jgi:hypothetical protein
MSSDADISIRASTQLTGAVMIAGAGAPKCGREEEPEE